MTQVQEGLQTPEEHRDGVDDLRVPNDQQLAGSTDEQLVRAFRAYADQRDVLSLRDKKRIAIQERIKAEIMRRFESRGSENAKVSGVGGFYKKVVQNFKLVNFKQAVGFAKETNRTDLFTHSINRKVAGEVLEDAQVDSIPGVSITSGEVAIFRKDNKA